MSYQPAGVIPACLLPFHPDYSIDRSSFTEHLRAVAAVDGVSALTVNAHSTEVGACSYDEQVTVLELTMDEVGEDLPVVAGVFSENTRDAQRIARMSAQAGASALLIFPPAQFAIGAMKKPRVMIEHHRAIADVTDLPLIFFQFPEAEGLGFSVDTLVELCDAVPTVRAVKDFSNSPVKLERTVRALQSRPDPVNVLTTHSAWLLGSLAIGCAGVLSGSGSTIAELQVALFRAVQAGDLVAARTVADRLFPINEVWYSDPFLDMHNRMKQAQVLLGRMPSATVRPPLQPLDDSEIEAIRRALDLAGVA